MVFTREKFPPKIHRDQMHPCLTATSRRKMPDSRHRNLPLASLKSLQAHHAAERRAAPPAAAPVPAPLTRYHSERNQEVRTSAHRGAAAVGRSLRRLLWFRLRSMARRLGSLPGRRLRSGSPTFPSGGFLQDFPWESLIQGLEFLDSPALRGTGLDFVMQHHKLSRMHGLTLGCLRLLRALNPCSRGSRLFQNTNTAPFDLSVHGSFLWNARIRHYHHTYYFSFVGDGAMGPEEDLASDQNTGSSVAWSHDRRYPQGLLKAGQECLQGPEGAARRTAAMGACAPSCSAAARHLPPRAAAAAACTFPAAPGLLSPGCSDAGRAASSQD